MLGRKHGTQSFFSGQT